MWEIRKDNTMEEVRDGNIQSDYIFLQFGQSDSCI